MASQTQLNINTKILLDINQKNTIDYIVIF